MKHSTLTLLPAKFVTKKKKSVLLEIESLFEQASLKETFFSVVETKAGVFDISLPDESENHIEGIPLSRLYHHLHGLYLMGKKLRALTLEYRPSRPRKEEEPERHSSYPFEDGIIGQPMVYIRQDDPKLDLPELPNKFFDDKGLYTVEMVCERTRLDEGHVCRDAQNYPSLLAGNIENTSGKAIYNGKVLNYLYKKVESKGPTLSLKEARSLLGMKASEMKIFVRNNPQFISKICEKQVLLDGIKILEYKEYKRL